MRARTIAILSSSVAAAACADILGISDGTPRSYDASVDATADASDARADVSDAGPDNFVGLHCGAVTCDFGKGESCCWRDAGFACVASPSSCSGVDIPCDRPEQCAQGGDAGPIDCCADYTVVEGGAIANAVACIPASQCNSNLSRFVLCGDDSGVECGDGGTCFQSSFSIPTFLICK